MPPRSRQNLAKDTYNRSIVAVKIRLKRIGKTRTPHYRIVVADSRTHRDGRVIEEIGRYVPTNDPSIIEVNSERAQYWLSVGAQPTEQAAKKSVVLPKVEKKAPVVEEAPAAQAAVEAPAAEETVVEAVAEEVAVEAVAEVETVEAPAEAEAVAEEVVAEAPAEEVVAEEAPAAEAEEPKAE